MRILVIETDRSPDTSEIEGVARAAFRDLTPELLRSLAPDMVCSPLIDRGYDAADLAHLLHDLRYDGRYRVLTPPLPAPDVVEHELLRDAPGLDLRLVELGRDLPLGRVN